LCRHRQVRAGVLANQHGTFFYGRGGWCPGQEVKPWTVDITRLLAPPGRANTVSYKGLFKGKDPRPVEDQSADIMMESSLVFYK